MVEYWNVDLIRNNKEVAFSLTLSLALSRRINQKPSLPSFQYSDCERSESKSYVWLAYRTGRLTFLVSVHRFPAQRDLRHGSTFRIRDKDKIEGPKSL